MPLRSPEYLYLQGFQCASNRCNLARWRSWRAPRTASACAQPHACWREMRATRSRASACAAPWTRSCAAPASPRRTPATCAPTSCSRCSARPRRTCRCRSSWCAPAPPSSRATRPIDLGRRSARAPIAFGDDLPEPRPAGERPGSLADGLDEVAAAAHRRRVRADLARALERPRRAAAGGHRRARRRRRGARRPGSRARPTTARSPTPRRGCAAICAGAWRASARSATSPAARASCSPTPRPRTPPRRPPPPPSRVGAALALEPARPAATPPRVPEPVAIQALGRARAPGARAAARGARAPAARDGHHSRPSRARPGPRRSRPRQPRSTSCTYDPSAYDC